MGVTDEWWSELLRDASPFTMLDNDRLVTFRRLAEIAPQDGDCAELGVRDGGVCLLLRGLRKNGRVWAIDTFCGLPDTAMSDETALSQGRFASEQGVKYRLAVSFVSIIQGVFPYSVTHELANTRFSLVHLDGDLYRTTRDGLEFFLPRMLPGGFIVLDDYGRPECPGVVRAVRECAPPETFHCLDLQLNQLILKKR